MVLVRVLCMKLNEGQGPRVAVRAATPPLSFTTSECHTNTSYIDTAASIVPYRWNQEHLYCLPVDISLKSVASLAHTKCSLVYRSLPSPSTRHNGR